MDSRHKHRIKLLEELFESNFNPKSENKDILLIVENLKVIDDAIKKYAPRYPIDKLAKIDLSILRLSIYELMIEKKNPPKVIIDEAVMLAKEYGNEKSYSFVNGVLGSILKEITNNSAI
ncbi:MAG: transcription antitermination factor NusB [Patescibacteria group bacterium]